MLEWELCCHMAAKYQAEALSVWHQRGKLLWGQCRCWDANVYTDVPGLCMSSGYPLGVRYCITSYFLFFFMRTFGFIFFSVSLSTGPGIWWLKCTRSPKNVCMSRILEGARNWTLNLITKSSKSGWILGKNSWTITLWLLNTVVFLSLWQ